MVDRKLLVEKWDQIEQTLCDMERPDYMWDIKKLVKGLYRVAWIALEYLIRRYKA